MNDERGCSLFISDLHLAEDRPAMAGLFLRFLADTAASATNLFILGDLFEFWVGDDTLDEPLNRDVADALSRLADAGTSISVMHGNRDFLVAEGFVAATRSRLLADPALLSLHGVRTLLMHGDTLCTDDHDYQRFRAHVHDPAIQRQFLALPLAARRQQVGQARARSEQQKQLKSAQIMDVAQAAVAAAFRSSGYPPRLIHGHTHRPARHELVVDGHRCERWVLADWYREGEYLRVDADGVTRHPLR